MLMDRLLAQAKAPLLIATAGSGIWVRVLNALGTLLILSVPAGIYANLWVRYQRYRASDQMLGLGRGIRLPD